MPTPICILGSINVDLVVHAPRFPAPGETLLGGPFETHPGGKGANQVVAAARIAPEDVGVAMLGCVGDDAHGARMREVFATEGIDASGVLERPGTATGVGVITVDASGQNHIVVASGANATVSPEDVERASASIAGADVLVLQLEIPLASNLRAAELASAAGTRVVLNAAPAAELPGELLADVDVLVVNEIEARMLARAGDVPIAELPSSLRAQGPDTVVVTLGERGALCAAEGEELEQPARAVDVVDTTAAGDAFVGALAVALHEQRPLESALALACSAGTLAVTCAGAVPSLPNRTQVLAWVGGAW